MGFTREHGQEALLHTNSLEQATEWILTHPPPPVLPSPPTPAAEAGADTPATNDVSRNISKFSLNSYKVKKNL